MNTSTKSRMENNSKIDKFLSKLTCLLNINENGSEKAEVKIFGKYDIAILTFIGILSTITILMVALRLVVQPPYWYLVDVFSIIMLITLTNSIVIRKIFKKK